MTINTAQLKKLLEPGVKRWVEESGFGKLLAALGTAMHKGEITEDQARDILLGVTKKIAESVNPGLRPPRRRG